MPLAVRTVFVRTLLAALLFSSHSLAVNFVPPIQWAQDAIRLDNLTVWVYGGQSFTIFGTRQLYALDISKPFSVTDPPWTDYSTESGIIAPATAFVALFPSADRQAFYAFQGGTKGWISPAFALYNTSTRSWSTPTFTGTEPSPREMSPVAYSTFDNNPDVYIYGGIDGVDTGSNITISYWSDLSQFNTQSSAFSGLTATGVNIPARFGHTATLLPSGGIVIIGGIMATLSGTTYILTWAPMLNIPVYDTTTGAWSTPSVTVAAGSSTPPLRRLHNAHLAADGYTIIFFGGDTPTPTNDGASNVTFSFLTQYKNALNDFFLLDTRSFVYQAKTLVSGAVPMARSGPSSVLVNNQLIVFFGQSPNEVFLNDLFVVDTNAWTVQSTFTPANYIAYNTSNTAMISTATISGISAGASASATPGSAVGGSSIGTGAIAGIAVGGVVIIACVGAFIFYAQSRRRQPVTRPQPAETYPFVMQYPPTSQYQHPPPPAGGAQGPQGPQPQYYDQSAALITPRPDQYGGYQQQQYYSQDEQHAAPHQPQSGYPYYQAPSPGPNVVEYANAAGGPNTYYPTSPATAQQHFEPNNAASYQQHFEPNNAASYQQHLELNNAASYPSSSSPSTPRPSDQNTPLLSHRGDPKNSVGDVAFPSARPLSYLPTYIATKPDSTEGYEALKPEAVETSPVEASLFKPSFVELPSVEPSPIKSSSVEPSSINNIIDGRDE